MSAEALRAPDAFDRFGERLADRVNPIVVKEVRQGLRTRVFWIFFSLMLVACLFISLFAFAASDGIADRAGQATFIAYFVCLGFVQFFVIPYAAYRSMSREAEDETWVLLTLTGIGPRRILAGKLGSSVLQGMLYASAATPFLLFSYFLNGIDLPTIIVGVVVSMGYQVFLVSVSVSLATLAESRLVRALLHFVLLGVLLQGAGLRHHRRGADRRVRPEGHLQRRVLAHLVLRALRHGHHRPAALRVGRGAAVPGHRGLRARRAAGLRGAVRRRGPALRLGLVASPASRRCSPRPASPSRSTPPSWGSSWPAIATAWRSCTGPPGAATRCSSPAAFAATCWWWCCCC